MLLEAGEQLVRVNQDTRLNFRVLDLRTSHSITSWKCKAFHLNFILKSLTYSSFKQFLLYVGFVEIHTPKLIAGSSEGGAAVFRLGYKGHPACLIQSPHLHRQMAICADFGRDFEISPAFSAEDSFTHRHLCEFPGLDVEMEIKKHYYEIMDKVDRLFVSIFDSLNQNCKKALEAYLRQTLQLTYEERVQMLKDAGVEIEPFGDLNTEAESKLGQLVLEKYGTEFYILYWYPLAVRPFYTRSCYGDHFRSSVCPQCRNVEKQAESCSIDVKTIPTYIYYFRYGAPTHRGFGVGLELVVMLFYSLNNIRKTSFYLGNPLRIAP
ncbi:Aspartate--tRNA ligase 2, cytoplasmic [Arachis hypogaea]|nr:Aspartate--tRNA ligase 2, cytoplasmic [Arachis hypogaea]